MNINNDTDPNNIFNILAIETQCYDLNFCKDKSKPILQFDQAIKDKLIYIFANNVIYIAQYIYTVDTLTKNIPTSTILKILHDQKLQPVIDIEINKYFELNKNKKKYYDLGDDIKYFKQCDGDDEDDIIHSINIKGWNDDWILLKNSWGTNRHDDGNIFVPDLKYLVCQSKSEVSEQLKDLYLYMLMINENKIKERKDQIIQDMHDNFISFKSSFNYTGDIIFDDFKNGDNIEENYFSHFNYSKYIGQMQNGIRHGTGIITYNDGDEYIGKWNYGQKHGKGIYKTPSGESYSGYFQNDKRHGHGIYKFEDGTGYDGEWKNGIKHGHGTYKYKFGEEYNGDWKDGKMHGNGTYKYADGSKYEGYFQNDERNNIGTYRTADGIYIGEWKDDKKHGTGTFRYSNGVEYKGYFQNDKLIKKI
jgi:hypothetical protein